MESSLNLRYGSSAPKVEKIIDSLDIIPSDNLDLTSPGTFNISTAQIVFREHTSLEDYIREMNFIVTQAVNQKGCLLCFPAYSGFLSAPLFPQYKHVLDSLEIDQRTGLPTSIWVYRALSGLASECLEVFTATMSGLARAHGIYIMGGTIIYPEGGRYRHRAVLFDPEGDMIGVQDKLSSTNIERELQIEQANELRIFETSMGNVAMLLTDDTNYFEVSRVAKKLGADILINPTAFRHPYTGTDTAQGLNIRVMENNIFGVQSVLIGRLPLGFTLGGRSGFFGPEDFCSVSAKDTMFAQTLRDNQTQILTARLSLYDLSESKQALYTDYNQEFIINYRKHLLI